MSTLPEPTVSLPEPGATPPASPRRRHLVFAEQEMRLISALVVLIGLGLFLALPFVLSIGSVMFLPLFTAIVLTIILSPLADKMATLGVPNGLASFLALIVMIAALALALTAVLIPAVSMFDTVPAMINRIGTQFHHLQGNFAWVTRMNDQIAHIATEPKGQKVVIAQPSMLEQVAFATPSVVLEVLLTLLMAFFMIEARARMRRRLLLERQDFGASLKAARVMRDVQDRVAAYILTVGVINLGMGIIVALGAWAMGMDAPIMWGGLAALLNFLPYIGPLSMFGILALFGVGTNTDLIWGLAPALAFIALHAIESNVVTPSILGRRFTMNPVLILLALSYFTWIWGVIGALLSVPLLLTVTALIDHLGKPNMIGFIFGEPLFPSAEETPAEVTES